MQLRFLILLMIGLVLCFSCNDEDKDGLIEISGITEMDNSGYKLGNIDRTDWGINDTWSENEENLFKNNGASLNNPTEQIKPSEPLSVVGYPNPAQDIIRFAFQLNDNMYYDMRVVDDNLNIKVQLDSMKFNGIDIRSDDFTINRLYRIYYKIYDESKVYRGHGDFKFLKEYDSEYSD